MLSDFLSIVLGLNYNSNLFFLKILPQNIKVGIKIALICNMEFNVNVVILQGADIY